MTRNNLDNKVMYMGTKTILVKQKKPQIKCNKNFFLAHKITISYGENKKKQ